ncbi:MAG: hypothetical protein PHS30_01925 [Bacteroidales bacterium]|nr:hypothetical protein [Bacteroidales bacterium]
MRKNRLLIILLLILSFQSAFSKSKVQPLVEKTDYVQIILYGQSLGLGWESPRLLSTTPIDGNFMIGDNVIMKYNNDTKVLTPMAATKWRNGGEQPIVACVNAFSKMYREKVNPNQQFIGMSGGEGGQSVERLSKECTNNGLYESTFLKILDNTKLAISGKSVSCPAILYMQGEHNCNNKGYYGGKGMTPESDATPNKDEYKALLLKLKNNMQADIMKKYGQKQKPLFFIYQTSGRYISMKEMAISMAQLEFSKENEDVILLNPHYALPDYSGGHLSTNGYRWYGEMMAKTLDDVLIQRHSFRPVTPEKISIKDKAIMIDYYVPASPLVLDTLINTKAKNFGFAVFKNGDTVAIKNVSVAESNRVVITCDGRLSGKIEIVYGGQATRGTGNLRDSDTGKSMYTYFDDSADKRRESYTPINATGTKIYNQPYPLQNWSNAFYYQFDVPEAGIIKPI